MVNHKPAIIKKTYKNVKIYLTPRKMLRADNIPESDLRQSSECSTIWCYYHPEPRQLPLTGIPSWGVAAPTPEPFPHNPHTREQGRWNQRSAQTATGVRIRQLENQWHFQWEEQRLHSQHAVFSCSQGREMLTEADYQDKRRSALRKEHSNSSCRAAPFTPPALQKALIFEQWGTGRLADRTREPKRIKTCIQQT